LAKIAENCDRNFDHRHWVEPAPYWANKNFEKVSNSAKSQDAKNGGAIVAQTTTTTTTTTKTSTTTTPATPGSVCLHVCQES
jgi:hypothetical protein